MTRGRRGAVVLVAAVGLLAAAAVPAQGSFHEIKVREVYAGGIATPGSDFIELQMFNSGQNLVATHIVRIYDSAGAETAALTMGSNVALGDNQRTVLLASSGPDFASEFPGVTPDFTFANLSLGTGGAVCFNEASPPDCVAWGNFTGPLPGGSGNPGPPAAGPGVPPGVALRRTIAGNCLSYLEPGDDTDNSDADFATVTPNPRPNSAPLPERPCFNTQITTAPPDVINTTSATWTFASLPAGAAGFECKLEPPAAVFAPCPPGGTFNGIAEGAHTFSVRAINTFPAPDPTPATDTFTVDLTAPPPDPGPGPPLPPATDTTAPETTITSSPKAKLATRKKRVKVTFAFSASEPATFACSLDGAGFAACSSPLTATVKKGKHTFAVRATDAAGNADQSPATYAFAVKRKPKR